MLDLVHLLKTRRKMYFRQLGIVALLASGLSLVAAPSSSPLPRPCFLPLLPPLPTMIGAFFEFGSASINTQPGTLLSGHSATSLL